MFNVLKLTNFQIKKKISQICTRFQSHFKQFQKPNQSNECSQMSLYVYQFHQKSNQWNSTRTQPQNKSTRQRLGCENFRTVINFLFPPIEQVPSMICCWMLMNAKRNDVLQYVYNHVEYEVCIVNYERERMSVQNFFEQQIRAFANRIQIIERGFVCIKRNFCWCILMLSQINV